MTAVTSAILAVTAATNKIIATGLLSGRLCWVEGQRIGPLHGSGATSEE